MASIVLDTDIYNLSDIAVEVQKQYMELESDRTRAIGINGYFADINSLQLQNATIVASEVANEMWPARAKFEKNVLAHAILFNIQDINAVPATITVNIGIPEKDLFNYLKNDKFILDKESPIYIGGFEYHLQYDLMLIRNVVENNEVVYTAAYDISKKNPLSSIENPYTNPPFIQVYNTERYLVVKCVLMQVEHSSVTRKLLTSNPIENKTFEFEFENQLADFEVKVTESGKTTYLTPVFEGVGVDQTLENYCYYTYVETNRIRVRFDSISYMPGINAEIEVLIKTTHGTEGNFEYNKNIFTSLSSDNYGYKNVTAYLIIASGSRNDTSPKSDGGMDRKSVAELRKMLPKEALARGSYTLMKDLLNYFDMLNDGTNRIEVMKKVDNQFERTYFAYLVLKDSHDNVIPTNTIDIIVAKSDGEFDSHDNRKYVLKPGCAIGYDDGKYGRILKDKDEIKEFLSDDNPTKFIYTVPFTTVLNDDPLYISYYLTLMNRACCLDFTYINQDSPVQFISTNITWQRALTYDPEYYKMNISLSQNIVADRGMLQTDENGNIIKNSIKVVAVFYNTGVYDDDTAPYRYFFGEINDFDIESNYSYDYHFNFKTTDQLNDDAKIKILDSYIPGSDVKDYGYFSGKVKVNIYILADFVSGEYGRYNLDSIVPGLDGYTVTNMYTIENGLNFFENFSDIVTSTAVDYDIESEYDVKQGFMIKSVPVIKLGYADDEPNLQEFISQLLYKKAYIDRGILLLENNFKIDFKLFNTYGPSRTYSLDDDGLHMIDRVNLTLNFEVKLTKASDKYTKQYIIKDIKNMIEDLNDLSSLHIPNLITEITNKYRPNSIEYIEFLGFNDYGPGVQHLYRNDYEDITIVPEFLTVHTREDLTSDINIRIV